MLMYFGVLVALIGAAVSQPTTPIAPVIPSTQPKTVGDVRTCRQQAIATCKANATSAAPEVNSATHDAIKACFQAKEASLKPCLNIDDSTPCFEEKRERHHDGDHHEAHPHSRKSADKQAQCQAARICDHGCTGTPPAKDKFKSCEKDAEPTFKSCVKAAKSSSSST
jgi:hypothetical protein